MHSGPRAIKKKTLWILKFVLPMYAMATMFFVPLPVHAAKDKRQSFVTGPRLTLRVYNYARLDSASLSSSENVATAIFRGVGIDPVWVDCPASNLNSVAFQACDSPMGPADFVLRILPRDMAIKAHHSQDALGFAQICPVSEPACELNVFYHRVDELATKGYRADRILGYAIAHEVGHILLGPSHSDDGIMRATWSPSDLDHISLGLALDFSPNQSSQLRLALLRRSTLSAPNVLAQANLTAP